MTWHSLQNAGPMPRPLRHLAEALESCLATASDVPPTKLQVVRLEVETGATDPLSWLTQQPDFAMTYWRDREGRKEMAGLGATMVVDSASPLNCQDLMARLHAVLDSTESEIFFHGGLAFACDRQSAVPASFPVARFILPRFEYLRRPNRPAVLACNLVATPERSLQVETAAALEELAVVLWLAGDADDGLPGFLDRVDAPSHDEWLALVQGALREIRGGTFEKVVLARCSTLRFDGPLHPPTLLRRLAERTPGCFHFYMQPASGVAFLGASPELLYERHGRTLLTEALAGTRPRGATPAEDAALTAELLDSEKDRREHRYVVDAIHRSLEPLCSQFAQVGETTVLHLARVQHLYQRAAGTLLDGVNDADVLAALHPTPAVGGLPREAALRHIANAEPFDRGWYAGPVGWVGRDDAAFAVGIRCGQVEGARLSLFSGAGIVDGSDPESEWREIESKLASFLQAIRT